MNRLLVLLVAVFGLNSAAVAQDAGPPKGLLGFLKPGMKIGAYTRPETDVVHIVIYGDVDFDIVRDAREMPLDELAAKYEAVAKARDSVLEEYAARLAARADELPANKRFGDPEANFRVIRGELLCTVKHAGEDYVLVSYGEEGTVERVYASQFISRIDWYSGPRSSILPSARVLVK